MEMVANFTQKKKKNEIKYYALRSLLNLKNVKQQMGHILVSTSMFLAVLSNYFNLNTNKQKDCPLLYNQLLSQDMPWIRNPFPSLMIRNQMLLSCLKFVLLNILISLHYVVIISPKMPKQAIHLVSLTRNECLLSPFAFHIRCNLLLFLLYVK